MRKIGLFLLLIGCFNIGTAQYTELINSRRPGFSDSPFSVGTNVLQFEGGLFYENQNNEKDHIKSFGTDIMVRYGKFFERLEVNLNLAFQHDKVTFTDPLFNDIKSTALSQLTIGAKYLVYMPKYKDKSKEIRSWKKRNSFDWKRLIPSVAVYAGANIPVTKNYIGGHIGEYVDDSFSPKVAIYTQNDFTDRFVFLMNLIMDKIGSGQKENSYILTGTYTLNPKLSVFVEHQGIFKDKAIPNDYQFGGGAAYLLSKNLQVDASVRTISDRDGSTFLFGAGVAWRLDRHSDLLKVTNSDGDKEGKKEGNFFSRLFKGKKDKEQRKVKKIKAKKRKIKELKPKKSKKQKRAEKEAKKKAKAEKKKKKKAEKDYDKNYEPPKNESVDDNN